MSDTEAMTKKIVDSLKADLDLYPELMLVYLFGSQVGGRTGPLSDYDFGLLTDDPDGAPALRARLAHDIGGVLGTDRVDVVVLNRAPIELAYAVISQGELIFQRDEATRVDFEARVLGLYGDYLPVLRAHRGDIYRSANHAFEFTGIERRLDELSARLARLEPLKSKPLTDFDADPYLRDIVERNLEVAAQRCIDISHRIISLEGAEKPRDYYEAILRLGELGILPGIFARDLASLAGFRNILVHEYVGIDWEEVYRHLQKLDDMVQFGGFVRRWLLMRQGEAAT